MADQNPTTERLENQIRWYDSSSTKNQKLYKRLKILQIIMSAAIPFLAGVGTPPYVNGGLGVGIVVLEGLQQVYQYNRNWINYRATNEALKQEKYLYLAKAGHYAGVTVPDALLAERVETIISRENGNWLNNQQNAGKPQDHAGKP